MNILFHAGISSVRSQNNLRKFNMFDAAEVRMIATPYNADQGQAWQLDQNIRSCVV